MGLMIGFVLEVVQAVMLKATVASNVAIVMAGGFEIIVAIQLVFEAVEVFEVFE